QFGGHDVVTGAQVVGGKSEQFGDTLTQLLSADGVVGVGGGHAERANLHTIEIIGHAVVNVVSGEQRKIRQAAVPLEVRPKIDGDVAGVRIGGRDVAGGSEGVRQILVGCCFVAKQRDAVTPCGVIEAI